MAEIRRDEGNPLTAAELTANTAAATIGHPLQKYFGLPLSGKDFDPRDRRFERNLTLPQAYAGRNEFLGELVEGLIFDDADFYTSEACLPMRKTDEQTFTWSSWTFDRPLLTEVPEEGVSRLVRSTYSSEHASTKRHGIALVVEHGFYNSGPGRQHYVRSLQQIANSTKMSINLEVMMKIVSCRAYDVEWERKNNTLRNKSPEDLLKVHYERFAALQKPNLKAEKIIDDALLLMNDRGVKPTTLLCAQGTMSYFRGVGEERLNYSNAGPLAVKARTQDIRYVSSYRNISLHQVDTFRDGPSAGEINPLLRHRTLGEYHIMELDPASITNLKEGEKYQNSFRDIEIHDGSHDEMVTLSFEECLRNADIYKGNNLNPELFGLPGNSVSFYELKRHGFISGDVWNAIGSRYGIIANQEGHPLQRTGANVVGESIVHCEIDPESLQDPEDAEQQLGGLIGDNELKQVKRAIAGRVGASTTEPINEEEIEALHSANVAFMENNVDPTANGAAKYQKVKDLLTNSAKRASFAKYVASQIHEGEDAVKSNVIANIDLLSGNKLSNKYKKALEKLIPVSSGSKVGAPVSATAEDEPKIYGYVKAEHVENNPDLLKACDAVTKEYCSTADATIGTKKATGGNGDVGGRIQGAAYLFDALTRDLIEELLKENRPIPLNIMAVRPSMEFQTSSLGLMRGGASTGETLLGESSVMLADDVQTKRHMAHFTLYFTAIVREPKAIHIIDDACVRSYKGGRNTEIMNGQECNDLLVKWGLEPDEDMNRKSIIPLVVPCLPANKIAPYIDLRGTWESNQKPGSKAHYATAPYYHERYQMHMLNVGTYQNPQDNHVNTSLYRGHSQHYNPHTGLRNRIVCSKGAFGRNEYSGMFEDMFNCGVLKDMNYEREKISVIGAQLV